jgi:Glycosyl hydrolase family 30 beta sandwich domain
MEMSAYHRYGPLRAADLEGVWQRAQVHGLKTAMLEKVGAGIDDLLQDLSLAHVSSWQQWAVASLADRGDNGAYYVLADTSDPDHPRISMAERTYHLAQVFRYVRRGAVRIGATSDNPDEQTVAFINRNGSWVTVVRARKSGGALAIAGLPANRYGVSFTGEDHEIEHWPAAAITSGQTLEVELPGPGVATAYNAQDEGDQG